MDGKGDRQDVPSAARPGGKTGGRRCFFPKGRMLLFLLLALSGKETGLADDMVFLQEAKAATHASPCEYIETWEAWKRGTVWIGSYYRSVQLLVRQAAPTGGGKTHVFKETLLEGGKRLADGHERPEYGCVHWHVENGAGRFELGIGQYGPMACRLDFPPLPEQTGTVVRTGSKPGTGGGFRVLQERFGNGSVVEYTIEEDTGFIVGERRFDPLGELCTAISRTVRKRPLEWEERLFALPDGFGDIPDLHSPGEAMNALEAMCFWHSSRCPLQITMQDIQAGTGTRGDRQGGRSPGAATRFISGTMHLMRRNWLPAAVLAFYAVWNLPWRRRNGTERAGKEFAP